MISRRHIIVALVPEPLATQLAELRRKYDVFTRQWLPPHVTIIPPFEQYLSRDEIAKILNLPVKASATLDGWNAYRRTETSVLHLALRDQGFGRVLDDLLAAVPSLEIFRPSDLDPHVTVVSRIPNEQAADIESVLTAQEIEGTFTVDRLTLFEWDDEVRRWIAVTR